MGYNATYGYQNLDCMTEFELKTNKKADSAESFLCQDELGNVHVKAEFRICDVCGKNLNGEIGYIHASYLYCEDCEKIHRKNEIKHKLNKRLQEKKNKIKESKP